MRLLNLAFLSVESQYEVTRQLIVNRKKNKPFEFQLTGKCKECAYLTTDSFVTPVRGRVQTFAKRTAATKGEGEAELSYDIRERTTDDVHTDMHTCTAHNGRQ